MQITSWVVRQPGETMTLDLGGSMGDVRVAR